jgi:PAS domain S-box-containing protein
MPFERTEVEAVRPSTVRLFVRKFRDEILDEWRRAARRLPIARDMTAAALLDHIPALLDQLAEIAEEMTIHAVGAAGATAVEPPVFEAARRHALDRLSEGFDAATVVSELSLLRGAALTVWARSGGSGSMAEVRALDLAIDRAIEVSVAITEQRFRQIAEERAQVLAKLESLLSASPVGIAFIDRDLRYLLINDALAALNEVPASAHVGRTVADVLPAFAPMLEPLLQGVLDTGQPVLDIEVTRPSRTDPDDTRVVLATFFPVREQSGEITGVGGIVTEVTEARRAQQALRLEQARIRSILEHAPAAIWVKDPDGRIVLANHRLADVLGHDLESTLGRRSADLLPREFAVVHEAHDDTVLREQRALEVEEVVPSPDGPRTFLSIKFPIPGDPPLVGGIATEITQRKQIEQELRIAVRTREDVLAIVSHDLRSPLGTVQLSATLLGQLATDHRAKRHLELIHRCCTRMENLIDDLLDTTSIRTGRLQLSLRPERAESVLTETLDLHLPIAEERGIRLVGACDVDDAVIACDRDRILQVFSNLVGNAIKFCRPGDAITVSATRVGEDVVFSVTDTGPGIAPDVAPHLFEPYWSGPGHAKQGAGLGLYISRGIVEGHGGRLWVEDAPGSGARFLFTLPAAPRAPITSSGSS